MLIVAIGLVIARMVPQFRLMQVRIDGINRVLREQITGIRVVRAFVREPVETERFRAANTDVTAVALAVGRLQALIFPIVMLVLNVSSVAVLWFGAGRIDAGQMQIGALTAFLAYLLQILMAVMMATFMAIMIPRAAVCADRIMEVLDTAASVEPPRRAGRAAARRRAAGGRRPRRSATRAPAAPVLRDVSFTARAGQTTAIIGSTGAGKTTLLSMVPRLYDATGGAVRVDGVDVRDIDARRPVGAHRPRAAAAVPVLRHGGEQPALRQPGRDRRGAVGARWRSRRARISCGPMPRGLAAPIAQGGTNVSGGQRQRLAIARALVRSPRSTCSTTRSPRSTSPPTPGCAPR